ncbi:MAG: NAD-dependent DNA ligase LigA [Holosporales bacterium]|jgi:DNA ligase (NAD+)|nr:NAD-dependent DNA ligase LigA [Holosporales bacterium]
MMQKKDNIKKKIEWLSSEIKRHDNLYYNKSAPLIGDFEYDELRKKLLELETAYPEFDFITSPSHNVGPQKLLEPFSKVNHFPPMLSLDNAFNRTDMEDFIERTTKFLNIESSAIDFCAEQKIDGLSVSIIYKKGHIYEASTRGNGNIGENITNNVLTIKDIPHVINSDNIEVRGEIYMPISSFINLNKERMQSETNIFSNTRNAASGSLRQLDPSITASRNLKFFAYSIISNENKYKYQTDILKKLSNLGFSVAEYEICENIAEIISYYEKMSKKRTELNYDIDGTVFKVNNLEFQKRLGFVGRSPRHSVAFKFKDEEFKTTLFDIELSVGRSGVITPVAILKPVNIGGVIISRSTLHNFEEIKRLDLRIGDTLFIKRSGEVIPKITRIDTTERSHNSNIPEYASPTVCPSCGTAVIVLKHGSCMCPNKYGCKSQIVQYIAYFVSKHCFNIDGFGKQQISIFYNAGILKNPIDIFELHNYPIHQMPGYGKLSANKLFKNIEKSRNIEFYRFITSLGINQIGEISARALAGKFKNVDELINCSIDDLTEIDGIGELMAVDIYNYFRDEINIGFVKNLLNYVVIISPQDTIKVYNKLSDKIIVFSGKFTNISREEIKQQAINVGARVNSSVSKNTDYLVIGENPGSKLKQALGLGIKIMSEEEWIEDYQNLG